MKKLHEIIKNLYINILKPIVNIEVLSNAGWHNIKSFNITEKQCFYIIKTKNCSILCTKTHILIDENHNEVLAIDSLEKNIITKYGVERVISVSKTDIYDNAYDLSLDDNTTHTYYCNGILSHNCLIIDEAAFIPKNIMDQFFASVMPIISSSKESKAIIVSTPNGTGNIFYEIWQQANAKDLVKNKEGWKPIEVYWFEVPGRDEEWKEQQIATFGKEKFAQEFNNEFLAGSSYSKLIPEDIIEKYRIQLQQWKNDNINQPKSLQIISKNGDKVYEFKVWHEFDASHTYIAAGDVSEGAGQDASVLYIFDITDVRSIKMCAKFSNNVVQPTEFAFITNKILSLYANPYFICESNGVGSSFIDILRDTFEYQNIVKEGKDGNYGIRSHIQSKIKACIWAKEILTTNGVNFELYDIDLIDEMTTFIKKNSNSTVHDFYKAMYGAHDDHIMTLIWAAWMLNPDIVNKYFIVVESFETEFGKILPLIIQPMFAYTYTDIKSVTNDPLYQQFKLLKDEAIAEYNNITKKEQNIINKKNTQNVDQYVRLQNEMYSKSFVIVGNDIGINSYDFNEF